MGAFIGNPALWASLAAWMACMGVITSGSLIETHVLGGIGVVAAIIGIVESAFQANNRRNDHA